ncbi:anti-sigma factor family protein [Amycolatopsis cihanbeyliensis]|uniref:Putative zinc finger protein n=1 Tax=Amycolatopsis cihanbeyliensis TaxID=1128664 RepID=A0A542DQV9_AMYCI|nr:zf-HC2 domain-containing protein [Amycolatopsis cihanbeyliensis]TQJ05492.1 putative zinc finger protein [Amycolatopsis cihanbeyliensis]
MTGNGHQAPLLGAYALGTLDTAEARAVQQHLASCPNCRAELDGLMEVRDMMGELPAEALLHGPPESSELVLGRTLRQVRTEAVAGRNRGRVLTGVAAVIVVGIVLAAGFLVGQNSTGTTNVAQPPPVTGTALPEGTRVISGDDPRTGARMTARVTPAAGWVRVNASVSGIPAGERCLLLVVDEEGDRRIAGSWVVSDKGAVEGTTLDGSAIVRPAEVTAVEVTNVSGTRFVSAPA